MSTLSNLSRKIQLLSLIIFVTSASLYAMYEQPFLQKEKTEQTLFLFVHGLGGDKDQALHYQNNGIIFSHQIDFCRYQDAYAYNGPEVAGGNSCVALGQEADINAIYNGLEEDNVKNDLIGVGVSKGAATLINAVATGRFPTIKALVLESPFCNANEVAYNVAYPLQYIPGGQSSAACIMETAIFPSYKANGIQPITSAAHAPHIPIILVHSKQDKLIPVNHSRKLYREFVKAGNRDVYLIETEDGEHANILDNRAKKRTLSVLRIIHLFYEKYNIPHFSINFNREEVDPKKREMLDEVFGKEINLADYQPSLEIIEEKINADEPGCCVTNSMNSSVNIFSKLFSSLSNNSNA